MPKWCAVEVTIVVVMSLASLLVMYIYICCVFSGGNKRQTLAIFYCNDLGIHIITCTIVDYR